MSDVNEISAKAGREARAKQQEVEGRKAREEYAADVEARDANTARLRALRLEREQAAAREAAAAPPPAARRRAVKTSKA